jgi:hypothetical protein
MRPYIIINRQAGQFGDPPRMVAFSGQEIAKNPTVSRINRASRTPRTASSEKVHLRKAVAMIRLIGTRPVTMTEITRVVRVSRATVFRLMAVCERDLGVRIESANGTFNVYDWGLLNPTKF